MQYYNVKWYGIISSTIILPQASPGGKDGAGSPPSRNEGNNGVSHMESDEQNTARPAEPEEIGEATSGADCVHPESQVS